jgi:hypothetical protein
MEKYTTSTSSTARMDRSSKEFLASLCGMLLAVCKLATRQSKQLSAVELWTFLKFLRRCESRDWPTGLDGGHIPTAPAAAPSRPVTDSQWLGRHANIQAQKGDIRPACLTGIYLFST